MTDAQIKTVVSANTADFEKGLIRMSRQLKNFEKQQRQTSQKVESGFAFMSTAATRFVGVLSVGLVANYANRLLDMAGNLKDLSVQSGVAASTLSALKSQLEQGGSSVDEFSSSITKMNRAIAEAALGNNKGLIDSFDRIGLSIQNLQQLSPEEQFFEIAKALAQVTDIGEQTRIGVDIFGRSFTSLLPLIKDTNGELAAYVDKMQQAGDALTDEQINRLDEFGDAMTRTSNALSNAVAGGFADFLKFFDDFESKSAGFDAIYNPVIESKVNAAIKNRQKAMDDYIAKAKAAGFATSATRGDLSADLAGVFGTQKKKAATPQTPATVQRTQEIKLTKEATKAQDDLNKKVQESQLYTNEMGGAFRDAFADAVLGAEDLSDVLGALSKRLQQIAFNKFVGDPLSKAADGFFSKIGGSLFDALPSFSFATGIKNVPYDMTARLHKGEQVVTRQGVDAMNRGAGGGITYNIDARGAEIGVEQRIMRSLAMVNASIESRAVTAVTNAQTRGKL